MSTHFSFILLICNVSSGRFYCELHSEELELGNGAEPSSEVGHRQNLTRPHTGHALQSSADERVLFEKPADPNTLSYSL